jgi:hypothetical protein
LALACADPEVIALDKTEEEAEAEVVVVVAEEVAREGAVTLGVDGAAAEEEVGVAVVEEEAGRLKEMCFFATLAYVSFFRLAESS